MIQKDSVVYLEISKVHPNKYNPNVMNAEKFEALMDFCRTHGAEQVDPIHRESRQFSSKDCLSC